MFCYIITYDLCSPNRDYLPLYNAIKRYRYWGKITESTWAILTEETAVQVRDQLQCCIDSNDRLFIIRSGKAAAWTNVIASNEWLKENLIK